MSEHFFEARCRGAVLTIPADLVLQNFLDSMRRDVVPSMRREIPEIGTFWHGQGGIYIDQIRSESGSARHLILPVAPHVTQLTGKWGCIGAHIDGADSRLDGAKNTSAMVEAGSEIAQLVRELEVDGHRDLYIPALHEARLIYINAPDDAVAKEWHWTSTQYSAVTAFVQDFGDGSQTSGNKITTRRVRPVRSFVI